MALRTLIVLSISLLFTYLSTSAQTFLLATQEEVDAEINSVVPRDQLDSPPVFHGFRPTYPGELYWRAVDTQVLMKVLVSKTGKPLLAEVVFTTHQENVARAIESIQPARFDPPMMGGVPVAI